MPKGVYSNPEERARKISEAHKKGSFFFCWVCGKQFWRKPSAIKKGENKFCSKECYFQWQIGKKKVARKPRDRTGSNNPNWRGGVNYENRKDRNGERYKLWRESVFKRDNWTCQKCGARSKKGHLIRLEAHHIKPFATYPELRFAIDNGLTLCKKCHDKEPKGKEVFLVK